MSIPDELDKLISSTEYREKPMRIVEALKTSNFESFNKDDKNIME